MHEKIHENMGKFKKDIGPDVGPVLDSELASERSIKPES